MKIEWTDRLSDEFDWTGKEPNRKTVIEEARDRGIESVDELIEYMQQAPENCSTGNSKWKWYKNTGEAFGF